MRVCTLGDLLLDVVVRPDEPLAPDADVRARTRVGAGGQAANVAAWAAALGARARWIGKRASDAPGALAAAELRARGVELVGPLEPQGTGVVVSLVAPDGARTMASDRGVSAELRTDELEPQWLAGVDVLHLPGYSLFRAPIEGAALRAAALVREQGGRVTVDLSAWTEVRDFGAAAARARVTELEPAVVFCNEDEERALGGPLPGPTWVVKRGARGCTVDGVAYAAAPAEAVDSTGAGDAFAAGFVVGGVDAGLAAAARCIARVGSMP